MTTPAFLTVAQAAPMLGISPTTVYALCASGQLHHRRIGPTRRMIRITENDIRAYLDGSIVARDEEGDPEKPKGLSPRVRPGGVMRRRPDGKPLRFFK